MPEENVPAGRFIVLTALPLERDAVGVHLKITGKEEYKGTIYERGTFATPAGIWEAALMVTGAGNVMAAVETERIINHFTPELVLFVGVAGGFKDVQLGDVVVATKVYWYESGKAGSTFQIRPQLNNLTYALEQLARDVIHESHWLSHLLSIPDPPPKAHLGAIAAGESVVVSKNSEVGKLLQESFGDTLAVEMESHGVLQAVRANEHVKAFIIRGISDLIDNKTECDAQQFQEVAARHASAFAFEMFSQYAQRRPHIEKSPLPGGQGGQIHSFPANDILLQDFLQSLEVYYKNLKRVCRPLIEGSNIYPDHCQRAADQFKDLEVFLERYYQAVTLSNLVLKLKVDNLLTRARELQPVLRELKHHHHILKGASISNDVHDKLTQFLGNLEYLIKKT